MTNSERMNRDKRGKKTLELFDALSSKTKVSIFLYLVIYRELTLDQLTELLGKSKSTVHHHIRKLLDTKVIEEHTKAGSKTKYYEARMREMEKGVDALLDIDAFRTKSPDQQINYLKGIFNVFRTLSFIVQNTLDLAIEHQTNELEDEDLATNSYKKLKEAMKFNLGIRLLTEKRYKLYQEEIYKLDKKFDQLSDEDQLKNGNTELHPYILYTIGLPVKEILDTKYKVQERMK